MYITREEMFARQLYRRWVKLNQRDEYPRNLTIFVVYKNFAAKKGIDEIEFFNELDKLFDHDELLLWGTKELDLIDIDSMEV